MLRGLFSFHRSTVLLAAMCLLFPLNLPSVVTSSSLEASALQELPIDVTLNSVTCDLQDSLVEVDIEITRSDSIDTLFVDGFNFAVAYDTLVMEFESVIDNEIERDCNWFFGFLRLPIDSLVTPNAVLWLVGADTSQTDCFVSDRRTITLRFRTKDDGSLYGTSTNLDFYWRNCHDNMMWRNKPDTTLCLVASEVFDAEGDDITEESDTLPCFTWPDSTCLNLLYGDTVVVPAIHFRSGKIEFASPTDVVENPDKEEKLPETVHLRQNYPNPFNPSTTIEFYLPVRTSWRIDIVNLNGQVVTGFGGLGGPGNIVIPWNGKDNEGHPVSSGVYFYRLIAGEHRVSKKMLLLR